MSDDNIIKKKIEKIFKGNENQEDIFQNSSELSV
jgi:hypothetical protein